MSRAMRSSQYEIFADQRTTAEPGQFDVIRRYSESNDGLEWNVFFCFWFKQFTLKSSTQSPYGETPRETLAVHPQSAASRSGCTAKRNDQYRPTHRQTPIGHTLCILCLKKNLKYNFYLWLNQIQTQLVVDTFPFKRGVTSGNTANNNFKKRSIAALAMIEELLNLFRVLFIENAPRTPQKDAAFVRRHAPYGIVENLHNTTKTSFSEKDSSKYSKTLNRYANG